MKPVIFLLILLSYPALGQVISTTFETSNGRQTPEYDEIIAWWSRLDSISGKVSMEEVGSSDAGLPLHVVTISNEGVDGFKSLRGSHLAKILINNGIHPGEPDGIDASMLLAKDIVLGKKTLPENIALVIIPVYNIGGCLNRSVDYRVDQNGPEEFGSRGNSQNLDLNRDFIKCDSKEALTFATIFHALDPDILIDNHVSNGADYQHTMTLIASQHNRLGGEMGKYLNKIFEPWLYKTMATKGLDLIPYVNSFGTKIENGWPQFWDSPRYSTGFASLWSTFAFMPETHMLKPYKQRVEATLALLEAFIAFAKNNSQKIRVLRLRAKAQALGQIPVKWKLDSSIHDGRLLKGFRSGEKASDVSGLPRLYYDRTKPYEVPIPFYNEYKAIAYIKAPKAYIIPKGWWKILTILRANGVQMTNLPNDSTLKVEKYRIDRYTPSEKPYEGHYVNGEVSVQIATESKKIPKGDWIVPIDQPAGRYLMEVLEPEAEDSFFAWNFFDSILQQKEGYSAYDFEDTASKFLSEQPQLRKMLDEKKKTDSTFAGSGSAQLRFVYEHSPWNEPAYLSYPILRIVE